MNLNKQTKKISIEMSGGTKRYMVSVKQQDRATRYIEVTLLDGGEEYEIPEDATVTAYIKKPDGKRVYTPCEHNKAKVTVELDSQATAAAGTALCEIEAKSADLEQVITSVTFEVEIEKRVKEDDAIQSSDEMSVLDTTLKAYADAEAKRVKAETARATAEQGRATAEQGRVTAENASVEAEKKRVTAEEARAKAESGRVTAESGRVTAETARQQQAQEVLDKANKAVEIASQINEASYILDADENVKYAFSIYAKRNVPHMALTRIQE